MKHLDQLEPGLNAYKVSFDPSLLNTLRTMFDTTLRERLGREGYAYLFSGMEQINIQMKLEELQFHITSYGTAPLLWVSNNNAHTYDIFRSFMTELEIMDDIEALVDFEDHIEVYCGFFVVGKSMNRETWHKDFVDGANACTLITPLFELDKSHGQLMYKDDTSTVNIYEYKMGEAIVFGDGFEHATQPYPETEVLRVMLSFTFGTDKAEYWNVLKETIEFQSNYMILPCGHEKGACQCFTV
ncbi:MAG: hypothetical protein RQ982_11560 [Gammaproteobacteria bacterium]|nr:hypothetical protein [Gammaproteobacteria bacterium]